MLSCGVLIGPLSTLLGLLLLVMAPIWPNLPLLISLKFLSLNTQSATSPWVYCEFGLRCPQFGRIRFSSRHQTFGHSTTRSKICFSSIVTHCAEGTSISSQAFSLAAILKTRLDDLNKAQKTMPNRRLKTRGLNPLVYTLPWPT